MFKVIKERRVVWPVLIPQPQDGGGIAERRVNVEFEDLPQPEQDEIYKAGGFDRDLMFRTVKGWKPGEFKDEAGNDIEFSPDALAALMDIAYVQKAFVNAYLELHHGKAAARKN
jgi:hypothetical protein